MADVKAIRDRIRDRVKNAVSGLNVLDYVPTNPILPTAIIGPAPGAFLAEVSMDGVEDLQLVVTVLVSKVVDENAQNALDTYLSSGAANNIADAIDSSSTADWDFAVSQSIRNYGQYLFGSGDNAQAFLGFEIPVHVGCSP